MSFEMLKMAYEEGIKVEYWDFEPPLDGIYVAGPSIPPVIGISNKLFECSPRFRCVLAEELGHHFTTVGDTLPRQFYHYRDRLFESQIELLTKLNTELAADATPEATQEIRENIKLMVELAGKTLIVNTNIEDLEERLEAVERLLFGDYDPDSCIEYYEGETRLPLAMSYRDQRDDLYTLFDWKDILEKHLNLSENWMDEAGE